jgi:hypothetical protein
MRVYDLPTDCLVRTPAQTRRPHPLTSHRTVCPLHWLISTHVDAYSSPRDDRLQRPRPQLINGSCVWGMCRPWRPTQECEPQREDFTAAVSVQEGETVYDYCWFSGMRATEPASCCFLTSTRHRPVHLWDAVTGELRATYRAYDHLDEIIAANCMAVDPDGTKLFLGCAASAALTWTVRVSERQAHRAAGCLSTPRMCLCILPS